MQFDGRLLWLALRDVRNKEQCHLNHTGRTYCREEAARAEEALERVGVREAEAEARVGAAEARAAAAQEEQERLRCGFAHSHWLESSTRVQLALLLGAREHVQVQGLSA